MRVLSLFSGVGGFDMGLEAAGMVTAFQCEIDKHARSVLDHHWPTVPKWGDISTLTGEHILEATGGVDVVAWGSPCQDLSLAGARAGLSGERSGLFHQGIRIIKELRELSNGTYPTWSIWENVVGALSSNGGADFGEVLYEMDEAGACFSEWVVLDAQYFGVPQRRRRVFVISCFNPATASRCPEPLFVIEQGGRGDSKKSGPSPKGSAGEIASCLRVGSGIGERGDGSDNLITVRTTQDVVGTPSPGAHPGGLNGQDAYTGQLVLEFAPIMFSHTQGLDAQPSEIHSPTLRREGNGAAVAYMVADDGRKQAESSDLVGSAVVGPLAARDYKGVGNQYVDENKLVVDGTASRVESTMQVRRLTPIECERLMGWPDNHTLIGTDGPIPVSQRFKMCGNGVASPVATWLGKHIMGEQ